MALFNPRELQEVLVEVLNTLVGKYACGSRQLFTSPVIKTFVGGDRPDYPFVTVQKGIVDNYGYNGVIQDDYDEDGNKVTTTSYKATFTIKVNGGVNDDTLFIASQIRDTLFRGYGIEKINSLTNSRLLNVSNPVYAYALLNTNYEEVTTIDVSFSVSNQFVETAGDGSCPVTPSIPEIETNGSLTDSSGNTIELDIDTI